MVLPTPTSSSRLHRLFEIAACMFPVAWYFVFIPCSLICLIALLFTPLYPLSLLCVAWVVHDRATPYRKGRRFQWARHFPVWYYFARYFPISLHKTAELDPNGCYILVNHPHAIIALASYANFATEANNVSELFPKITFWTSTLDYNLSIPFLRELYMAMGTVAVSASSMIYKLTKMGPGQAFVVIVGGAAEAALSDNDDPYRLKLKDRKGFAKIALQTGAAMVPVFTFGEMDIFTVKKSSPTSFLGRFQHFMHRKFRFFPIIFYGQWIFLPYRKPMHTVVGAPIPVPTIDEPTHEDVDRYHKIYVEALQKLFDENVEKYGDPTKKLQIL